MSVKTLQLFTFALLTSAIAIPRAFAQATGGVSTPSVPSFGTPTNTFGTPTNNAAGGTGPGNYGPGNYGPGTNGPAKYGPGNYKTGGSTGPGGGTVTPSPP
jgi:hypothetical protein